METLRLIAARLVIGEQPSEELPGVATEALLRGLDSPLLREAAGSSPRDVRVARDVFVAALTEIGVELPDEQGALWLLVEDNLRRVVDGSLNACDAASWIWHWAYWRVEREGDLRIFVGLASDCEDGHRDNRPAIEEAIRRAAAEYLAQGGPRSWLKLQARVGESPVRDPRRDRPCAIDDLPIGEQLKVDLREWADDFDKTVSHPGRGPSQFRSVWAAEQFVSRGARLVEELQQQLGDQWHVEYMPTARAFPSKKRRSH